MPRRRSSIRCFRCPLHPVFPTKEALQQHKIDSDNHFVCDRAAACKGLDFDNPDDLVDHWFDEHLYCADCEQFFHDEDAQSSHNVKEHGDRYCQDCDDLYDLDEELAEHDSDVHGTPHCLRCNIHRFPHQQALEQHKHDSERHHICHIGKTCREVDYETREELLEHWEWDHPFCRMCEEFFEEEGEKWEHDEDEHSYCQECEEFFKDDDERALHYVKEHGERYCEPCEELFNEEGQLATHKAEEHDKSYCEECEKLFNSPSSYRKHRQSRKHAPFDKACGCGQFFLSYSDILRHLESGACDNGIKPRQLNQFVLDNDPAQLFIKVSNFESTNPSPATIEKEMLSNSFNGNCWKCWMCSKRWTCPRGVLTHVQSSVHQKLGMYVCPGCDRRFKSFSALSKHIDIGSGGCEVRNRALVVSRRWELVEGLKGWRKKDLKEDPGIVDPNRPWEDLAVAHLESMIEFLIQSGDLVRRHSHSNRLFWRDRRRR